MKHYFPLFVCLILCVCLLCGCGCKHEWSEAACEQPKTCSACGLTEGEALGHSWLDATCTAPRTCSACGAEEGEALGHNWFDATCTAPETCGICGATQGAALNHAFGSWNILEDNMVHSCAYCALEESRPVDYQFLLEQELPGIWTLSLVVDTNDRVHDVKNILASPGTRTRPCRWPPRW